MLTETQSILFQTIPLAILITIGIYNLSYSKLKPKELFILFSILSAGLLISGFYFLPFMLVSVIFTFIYLYLIQKSNPAILLTFPLSYILTTICCNLLSVVFIHFLSIDTRTLQHHISYFSAYIVASIFVYYLLTYAIGIFIKKWIFHENVSFSNGSIGIIFTNLIVCCVLLVTVVLAGAKIGYPNESIVFTCVFIFIFFLMSVVISYQTLKANQNTILAQEQLKQYEKLKEYTANLEQVYNSLRSFKHDYVNIMASISSYLDEKRYDDLYNYFHTNIVPLQQDLIENADTLNQLMHIKQLEIKSLLSYKMIYAMENNISIVIDIPDDIEHINMNSVDFIRLLGIYLDNAIEAALEADTPKVNLHLANMDTYVALLISNSFVDKNLPISKMSELYSTTKGSKHGIGLYNADTILQNYKNVFHETYIENDLFFQHLQITN